MGPNHKINYDVLLDRMLSGKITSAEKDDLQQYIQNSFKDNELDLLMRKHWLSLERREIVTDEVQLLILKNKILSRINQNDRTTQKEYRIFSSNWQNYLIRIAAVLFIPLLLGSIFVFYRMDKQIDQMIASTTSKRVVANPGSRVQFTLPDQTEVWLNSGSSLEFPLALAQQDSRKVKLTGQGYFKVAHDKEHPFFVETGGISIQALGTSFDVSSYDNDKQISSTLEEGAIVIIGMDGKESTRIHPGQKAVLDKATRILVVKDVETQLYTSWKDGKLIFRNTSLTDVTIQLERWFNCKIHLDPVLMNADLKYTATIQDETLGEVLKMIEVSTRIKTRIEKREVYIES